MGSNIIAYIEYTITGSDNSKTFVQWSHVALERDYTLFALMANVRNRDNLEPVSSPRGLPKDVADGVQDIYQESDWYYPSWLNLPELKEVQQRYCQKEQEANLFLDVIMAAMYVLEQGGKEESRLVFWFDNS